MTPMKNFEKGPRNFWALIGNSSKVAKVINFEFGRRAPGESPDMTLEKPLEKGAWPESCDP